MNLNSGLVVFVAAHKDYEFPTDSAYRPIHVGRASSQATLPFAGDDTGDNISASNASYCELTGLYWAWKNTAHEYYGLAHYRRYFAGGDGGPATGTEMRTWLNGADVVVPKRRHYVIESVRKHYANAHHESDLDAAREAVAAISPEYLPAFDKVMAGRSLHLYNMFLMRHELLNDYCGWLFSVLQKAETSIPLDSYGPQQARVMGYLGERLFNVWLTEHGELHTATRAVHNVEGEQIVRKGIDLLKRKMGQGRQV